MKRFVCWQAGDAYTIINPDADALPDYVFRAVHTDVPVRIKSGDAGEVRIVRPATFLEELLRPKDHALVPIVGHSGTGKSHLIRWLDLQLRDSTGNREVIYVPKAQTNLRDIVRSIVRRLPEHEQEGYLDALAAAGGAALSTEAQRTAILNQLHLAVVNDKGGADPNLDLELENYVLSGLRAMLSDPYLRTSLIADHSFAADLAAHVFEKPERYEPTEGRREFRERDLPLDVRGIQRTAQETREFLAWLLGASSSDRGLVVDRINHHLDWAIGNCLNMTGDRVIELMLDLRRHIRRQGHELVLLIEDFARLQGLDRALLQSIIEQRPDLCVLRTVFASTGGFYESVRDTVRTRFTFIVDMDTEAYVTQDQLNRFVARYLNALRWGQEALREQWGEVQRGQFDFHVPSKCTECTHREGCHRDFGSVESIGLYPLTAQAVSTMSRRASARSEGQSFNPRDFQKRVLRPIAASSEALRAGQFPPPELLADLGGASMSVAQQERLKREDSAHWRRRLAMLELWGDGGEIRNLSSGLHEAFDLPPLVNVQAATDEVPQEPVAANPSGAAPLEDERLRELQRWNEGREKLSTSTAQKLRELVFAALEAVIDWDDLGLAKAAFFGRRGTGLFRAGDVGFQNQATQFLVARYHLTIPGNWTDETERKRVTMALQGLLEADAAGSWGVPDGLEKLACLGECLRDWSLNLIEQFRTSDSPTNEQNVAVLAFDLRTTVQVLVDPTLSAGSDQELIRAGLTEALKKPPDFITAEFNAIAEEMSAQSDGMLDIVRTRYSASKGGVAGDFIDAARLLPLAKALRSRRLLPLERTDGSASKRNTADSVRQLASRWASAAATILAKEAGERESAKDLLYQAFGERLTRDSVSNFVQKLAEIAGQLGVVGVLDLQNSRARFDGIEFAELLASLRAANASKPDIRALRSGVGSAVRACKEIARLSTDLMTRTEGELAARLGREGVDPETKARLSTELRQDLIKLGEQLARYHDGNAS